MTEEQMLAAIKYVEENSGSGQLGGQDKSFVTLAKSLAQVLKAKLVKVEDEFGSEGDLKCYRFGTGIVNVIHPEGL